MQGPKARPIKERFYEKFIPVTESGCWIWEGSCSNTGYGSMQIGTNRKPKAENAHKLSWIIHNGKVPEGMYVLHKCDVRACVNPDHLFLGTHQDNMKDMVNKGRHWKQR